jgi:hypothetical protein
MQVLGSSTVKREADAREGTPQKDARGTARPNADVASETPERKEEPVGWLGTNNL